MTELQRRVSISPMVNGQAYTYISRPKAEVQLLRAEVRRLRERGYIDPAYRLAEIDGFAVAEVKALRPLPRPVPRKYVAMGWVAIVLSAVLTVGWLIWESRYVIGAFLAGVLGVLLALRVATGHNPACTGLHCPGCRG